MKKLKFILGICLLLVLAACDNEELPPLPSVETLDVELPNDGGAILKGNLSQFEELNEHGFIYSSDSFFRDQSTTEIDLGAPSRDGQFEFEINTGLLNGTPYYVKAYGRTSLTLYEGEIAQFVSGRNKNPVIQNISPNPGHFQDTLVVTGRNFGNEIGQISAYFTNTVNQIISVNDSTVEIIVSDKLDQIQTSLIINVLGQEVRSDFSLATPRIDSFEPVSFSFGDTITIYGDHFDIENGRNSVFFENEEGEIISSSRKEIVVMVPERLQQGTGLIKINSHLQEAVSSSEYQLAKPIISEFPECTRSFSIINIFGENFHPDYYENKVFIGVTEAEVLSGNKEQLEVRVPDGPFPDGEATITISFLGIENSSDETICISDEWLMISNTLPFNFYGAQGTFVINETAYVMSRSSDFSDNDYYLWRFNEPDLTWTQLDLPFEPDGFGIIQGNGSSAYLYTPKQNNNFWEFNGATETWTQKTDFPGPRRDRPAAFSIGEHIYFGIGSDFDVYLGKGYNDFYRFTPSTNSWTRIADFDTSTGSQRTEATTFSIGNSAYLLGGARSTGMKDVWKYDSGNNQWTRLNDFGSARQYMTAFVVDGVGFIANGSTVGGGERNDSYRFDSNSNTFNSFYDVGPWGRYRGFSFVVNGVPYIGGGSGSSYNRDITQEFFKLTKFE